MLLEWTVLSKADHVVMCSRLHQVSQSLSHALSIVLIDHSLLGEIVTLIPLYVLLKDSQFEVHPPIQNLFAADLMLLPQIIGVQIVKRARESHLSDESAHFPPFWLRVEDEPGSISSVICFSLTSKTPETAPTSEVYVADLLFFCLFRTQIVPFFSCLDRFITSFIAANPATKRGRGLFIYIDVLASHKSGLTATFPSPIISITCTWGVRSRAISKVVITSAIVVANIRGGRPLQKQNSFRLSYFLRAL